MYYYFQGTKTPRAKSARVSPATPPRPRPFAHSQSVAASPERQLPTSPRSSPATAPSREAARFWEDSQESPPVPWGAAEDREVHPWAEKRFEIEADFEDQASPQTILQMGKLETQRRETLVQVTPRLRAEARNGVFSGKMGVHVRTVHAGAVAEALH